MNKIGAKQKSTNYSILICAENRHEGSFRHQYFARFCVESFAFYPIYQALIYEDTYSLVVSQEILLEYEEVITQQMNGYIARQNIKSLENSQHVVIHNPTFHWNLIEQDSDDNKFVDCAVSGNADFIVTHDRHFAVLAFIPFPVVSVISLAEFQQQLGIK